MNQLSQLISLALYLALPTTGQAVPYPFRESYPLETSGPNVRGNAVLTLPALEFRPGDKMQFDIRFINEGADGAVYNPFFSKLHPLPVGVAVYDAEKRYLGKYPGPVMGSQAPITDQVWVYIRSGGYVGGTFWGPAAHIPDTVSESRSRPLPPGRYYLQAIYYNAFIGRDTIGQHMSGPEDGDKLRKHFDTNELFRSNVVEIQILE